jgi:hypothetical protein
MTIAALTHKCNPLTLPSSLRWELLFKKQQLLAAHIHRGVDHNAIQTRACSTRRLCSLHSRNNTLCPSAVCKKALSPKEAVSKRGESLRNISVRGFEPLTKNMNLIRVDGKLSSEPQHPHVRNFFFQSCAAICVTRNARLQLIAGDTCL